MDATVVFAREAQVYLLALREMPPELHERMSAAYSFYLDGIERALSSTSHIAGNNLSLADISFVCDVAQFLGERRARKRLKEVGLEPISESEPDTRPLAFDHLFALASTPEFAKHFGTYLDETKRDLEIG